MSSKNHVQAPASYRFAGAASLTLFALTAVHHAYGALIYNTPWRLHVAVVAPIVGLAIACLLYLGGSRQGTKSGPTWTKVAVSLILIMPVGMIGLFEGGYNHLAKLLAFAVLGEHPARGLFPASMYEMPNDALFELTGVAQLPLALYAGYLALALLRKPQRYGDERA